MSTVTVNIKKNLPSLDNEKILSAVDLGMFAGAKLVQAQSQKLVPVDSGLLRNSIFVRRVKRFIYSIGTPVNYGAYVEYGTKRATAKPYLRPAAFNNVANIAFLISKFLSRVI